MTKNVLCLICAATVASIWLSGCTMPHGDATLSSRGDGLHLGGNLGVQVGGSTHGGDGGGPGH